MKRLMYVTAMAVMMAGSGCDKDDDNNGTPTATYMPTTANSTWSYSTKNNVAATTGSYIIKATNKDTTFNSKTYRVFTNTSGPNDYYAQVGTDYYQYSSFSALGAQQLELLYAKDAAAGTTWAENRSVTFPGAPLPVTVPVNYVIAAKGFDTTISGKAYKDVMRVKTTLGPINAVIATITPVTDINLYYARGVGRIYSRSRVAIVAPLLNLNVTTDDELTLTSYTIQ